MHSMSNTNWVTELFLFVENCFLFGDNLRLMYCIQQWPGQFNTVEYIRLTNHKKAAESTAASRVARCVLQKYWQFCQKWQIWAAFVSAFFIMPRHVARDSRITTSYEKNAFSWHWMYFSCNFLYNFMKLWQWLVWKCFKQCIGMLCYEHKWSIPL